MSSGNSIAMEYFGSQFLSVFLLLDKKNFIEIVLLQIERKYSVIHASELDELRRIGITKIPKEKIDTHFIY